MFADDTVMCSETQKEVEEGLERGGIKVCKERCNREAAETEAVKVEFKYLRSTLQSNRQCTGKVKMRV